MKVKWLIENFVGDNGYEDLITEVRNQGMECIVLDIRNHFELRPGLVNEGECVVFQGSIQLFKKLKAELPVTPLGWMTDVNYLCSKYYPHVQKHLFNDWHAFTTVGGLKHNKWNFYATFAKDTLIYVRPDGGDKTFTGRLLDLQDFDGFWTDIVHCNVTDDSSMVVVSTPKSIRGEWRFIVTNRKEILGVSLYKYNNQRTYVPSAPPKAHKLVHEILETGWYPDPVFTIDIVEDFDGNYWLMEMNSFTSAGTYAAPKNLIVEKVSEIAFKEWCNHNQVS